MERFLIAPDWTKILAQPVQMRFLGKAVRYFLLAGATMALAGESRADNRVGQCGGKEISAVAAETIDGTSFRLTDGTELKLASVISPSVVDGDDAAQAQALAALKQMIAGKKLAIFAADGRDRYGRTTAHAVLIENSVWLEAALVEAGHLRAAIFGNENCVTALLEIERKARAAGAGLWAKKKFQVFAADDIPALDEAIGRFTIVEGTIRRVGNTKARLYLDFGRRFTEDFTIVVPNAVRNALAAKGSDPKNWRGKRVRVRGVLISWGGPAIEISAAAAIEFLDSQIPEKNE